jgi:hypothetical protein
MPGPLPPVTPRSTRRRAVTALAALLAVVAGAAAAGWPHAARAHEQDPHLRTVLESVIPAPPAGVAISVSRSVISTEMLVENHTPQELEVLTATGRPFLRIGPQGVLGDLDTPDWYQSNNPYGTADVPPAAQVPGAPPRWGRVSSEPTWGWFEHRMHPTPSLDLPSPPASGVQTISRWIVPLRYGTEDLRVLGRVEYVTFRGQFGAALTSSPTPFDGVRVSVIPGRMPGVFLSNSGLEPVLVMGRAGEPFLRVGPAGSEVNLHSPTWVDNLVAQGISPTVEADATASPQWQPVHEEPRMEWLEPRGLYPSEIPPPGVVGADHPTVVVRWSIPVLRGAATSILTGETSFVPTPRPASTEVAAPDGGSLAVGVAMWLVLLALLTGAGLLLRARHRAARGRRLRPSREEPPAAATVAARGRR